MRWLVLAFVLVAAAAPVLDLDARRIERQDLPPASKAECKTYRRWRNVLRFDGVATPVPLARADECTHDPLAGREWPPDRAGLDPATLAVGWLAPGRLVWVRWSTASLGSGRYIHDGYVLLAVDGKALREVLRTNYLATARSGWIEYDHTSLTVRFEEATSSLTLTETSESFQHSGPNDGNDWTRIPLAIQHDDAQYFVKIRGVKEWRYRFAHGRLRYRDGRELIDLGEYGFPVDAVARHFHVEAARLLALNPGRQTDGAVWTGLVVVRDALPPYAPDGDDGFCGDKPCAGDEG